MANTQNDIDGYLESIADEAIDESIDMDIEALLSQFGYWGEHPEHPSADWQFEVANNATRMGYWEWVQARIDNSNDN